MISMQDSSAQSETDSRDHFWDSLRALLLLLGIPYHAALSYQPGQDFIVRSGEGAAVFPYLAEFIHIFRMPAFFMIAGYFSALLLARREPETWLKARFLRLGVPFVMAIATLVPVMNFVCELSTMSYADAMGSWWHNSLSSGGYWVRHLWFIVVLLYCSTAAVALLRWRPALRVAVLPIRFDRWIAAHPLASLLGVGVIVGLWEAAAVEAFYYFGFATNIPQQVLRLDELIMYAPYYIMGCVLARSPHVLERVTRFSPDVAVVALFSTAFYLLNWHEFSPAAGRFMATIAALAMTQTLIAAARSLADRPIPLIQRLTKASFVIYLFHMPIVVSLVWAGQYVVLPVEAKFLVATGLTLLLSYGAWVLISRSKVLSFLYNGDRMPAWLRPSLKSPARSGAPLRSDAPFPRLSG